MSALVSVIIPVYNLENYIENCLNSITNQTYSNIEIICIDDGSTDSSAEKIKQLSELDNRIRYFYQQNAGVSAARNDGLQKAQGDYITFVDGDDYLHPQAVELWVECAVKNNANVVFADYIETKDTKCPSQKIHTPTHQKISFQNAKIERPDLLKPVWGKLIKSSLLSEIKFVSEFSVGEDTNYIVKTVSNASDMYYINSKFYYYYIREGSATNSKFSMKHFSVVYAYDDLCDFLKSKNSPALLGFSLYNLYMYIFSCRTSAKYSPYEKEVNKQSAQIAKKHLSDMLKSKELSPATKLLILAFLLSRHAYELVRLIKDPTMKEFYRNRKNNKQ